MNKQKFTNKQKLQRLTIAAVMASLSIVLMMTVRFSIFPAAPFYEMEFSDVPILICFGVLGPVYSLVALLAVCVIQTLTVSATSGLIGFLMHFVSSALMIVVMHFVKNRINGINGIIISAVCGVAVVVITMIPLNILMVTAFMPNLTFVGFVQGFLGVCVAFNTIKAGTNIVLYNLISPVLESQYKKMMK